jgi:hypothetical protein
VLHRAIANLVDAIARGADPELLLAKQDELKATRDDLRQRLGIVKGELASLPEPAAVQAEAATLRKQLAKEHTGKDWRKESPESLERFLEFMFGTDPKGDGLGIYLYRKGDALTVDVRARLHLRSPEPGRAAESVDVEYHCDMMDDMTVGPVALTGWQMNEAVVAADRIPT